jgi:predicted O-methyltransferase YrrM
MTQQLWTAVDDYINDLFISSDPVLEATLAASEAAGLPSISVSPTEGKLLMLLARLHGARTILEIGTLGGYSTIWLARALPAGGTLITLEASPKHAEVAIANIARAGLGDVVDVRVGPALETLPILAEARAPFDLIFIDANKENYPEYLTWALKLSRRGTLIITDNVIRDGEVLDTATSDPRIEGTRRFHQQLASEPRVSATIMQTVGRKGYDGIAIAIVVADQ